MAHFPPTPARKLTFSPSYSIFARHAVFMSHAAQKMFLNLLRFNIIKYRVSCWVFHTVKEYGNTQMKKSHLKRFHASTKASKKINSLKNIL